MVPEYDSSTRIRIFCLTRKLMLERVCLGPTYMSIHCISTFNNALSAIYAHHKLGHPYYLHDIYKIFEIKNQPYHELLLKEYIYYVRINSLVYVAMVPVLCHSFFMKKCGAPVSIRYLPMFYETI